MADAVFSFELEGNGDAARDSAAALEQLREKLLQDTAALSEMNKAFRALKGSAHAGGDGFRRLKDQIAAQKAAIANSHAGFLKLGGDFKNLKRPTADVKSGFDQFAASARGSSGPLGKLAGGLEKLRGLGVGGAMAAGYAAIGAAFLALAAAAVVATAALFRFGLVMADNVRSERLQLEGLTKIRNWYGLAADKAADLQSAIARVSASSALGADEIGALGKSLYQANLRGAAWRDALEGLAIVQSAAGAETAAFYQAQITGAGRSSAAVKRWTDDIRARFGGVAKAQMLSLSVQSKKLHESFRALFSGLKIEGFLESLHKVTNLFSQNTVTGRALKTILETAFQPLIDFGGRHGAVLENFFYGLVIGAQLLVLGVLKLRNWFRKTFGDSEVLAGIDKQRLAVYAGAAAVGAFTAAMLGLAVVAAAVAAPFVYAAYRVAKFGRDVHGAYVAFTSIDWVAAGKAVIDGIVNGLTSGAERVVSAVKNLGARALKTFDLKLEIRSPSRAFKRRGMYTAQGYAEGVDAGGQDVARAVGDMGGGALAAAPAGGGPMPRLGGGGGSVTVNLTVQVQSTAQNPQQQGEELGHVIAKTVQRMLEGVSINLGAPVPG
jgi:hypothetical protein